MLDGQISCRLGEVISIVIIIDLESNLTSSKYFVSVSDRHLVLPWNCVAADIREEGGGNEEPRRVDDGPTHPAHAAHGE